MTILSKTLLLLTLACFSCLAIAAPAPSPMDGDHRPPKLGKLKTKGKTRRSDRSELHQAQEQDNQETYQHPGLEAGFYSSRAVRPSTQGATSSRRSNRASRSRNTDDIQADYSTQYHPEMPDFRTVPSHRIESASHLSDYEMGRIYSLYPNMQEGGDSSSMQDSFASMTLAESNEEQPETVVSSSSESGSRRAERHRRQRNSRNQNHDAESSSSSRQPRKPARLIWQRRNEAARRNLLDIVNERICLAHAEVEPVFENQLTEALEADLLSQDASRITSALMVLFPDADQDPAWLHFLQKEDTEFLIRKWMQVFDDTREMTRRALHLFQLTPELAQILLTVDDETLYEWGHDADSFLYAHLKGKK
ncbi:hypothetical protein CBS101457_000233 [Exobasidium rhododendri]|nr:hypothetical protein CBS101457_000233 [Exobasidium rhododendri]